MSGDGDVTPPHAVDLQLEAMSKHDCSWHPCQVHLCSNGAGLEIHYEDMDSKEILVSDKEVMARLRARSLPLCDDDCAHIKQGEHVVVNQKSQPESLFFDAEVVQVKSVRHSRRSHCKCTFKIKWLQQHLGESLMVTSSSIMKLSNMSINNHPIISEFLDAVPLNNSNVFYMSVMPNVVNDIDFDLHELLQKQIDGIQNSVDASKEKVRDEKLGLKAPTNESVKESYISVSNAPKAHIQISPDKSHLRRSTRSRSTPQSAEVKDMPVDVIPSPSVEEKLPEKRSPLNPLAARAALASLMSKLPQSVEISSNSNNTKSSTEHSNTITKLSSKIEATPEPDRIVKQLFSSRSVSETSQVSKVSSTEKLVYQSGKGQNGGNKLSSVTNRRLTRSVLQKEGESQTIETAVVEKSTVEGSYMSKNRKTIVKMAKGNLVNDIEESNCTLGMKNSRDMRRVTRSLVKETGNDKRENIQESGSNRVQTMGVSELSGETDSTFTDATIDLHPIEGKVTIDGRPSHGSKRKSSDLKKHEVRSSPRLRSLSKTQS